MSIEWYKLKPDAPLKAVLFEGPKNGQYPEGVLPKMIEEARALFVLYHLADETGEWPERDVEAGRRLVSMPHNELARLECLLNEIGVQEVEWRGSKWVPHTLQGDSHTFIYDQRGGSKLTLRVFGMD